MTATERNVTAKWKLLTGVWHGPKLSSFQPGSSSLKVSSGIFYILIPSRLPWMSVWISHAWIWTSWMHSPLIEGVIILKNPIIPQNKPVIVCIKIRRSWKFQPSSLILKWWSGGICFLEYNRKSIFSTFLNTDRNAPKNNLA